MRISKLLKGTNMDILSKTYIILFLIFLCIKKRIRLSRRLMLLLWGFFTVSLATVAYNIDLKPVWDAVRHFSIIDRIRASGSSFWKFMNPMTQAIQGNSEYTSQITFKVIQWVVARFTDDNYLLLFFTTFIVYGIIGYINYDWSKDHNAFSILSIALCFLFLPYLYVVTGIRNGLAATIAGLSIYLYLYKKKSLWLYIALMLFGSTIHPAILLTVPFVILARLKVGLKGVLGVLIILFVSPWIARWMAASNVLFFRLIGGKYLSYTSDTQYRNARFALYSVLVLTAIFSFIYLKSYNKINHDSLYSKEQDLLNFLGLYSIYIFSNIGNYDMVLRPAYVLGSLSPVMTFILLDSHLWSSVKNQKIFVLIRIAVIVVCAVLCVYVNGRYVIDLSSYL